MDGRHTRGIRQHRGRREAGKERLAEMDDASTRQARQGPPQARDVPQVRLGHADRLDLGGKRPLHIGRKCQVGRNEDLRVHAAAGEPPRQHEPVVLGRPEHGEREHQEHPVLRPTASLPPAGRHSPAP